MKTQATIAIRIFLIMTLLTGVLYPLLVTGIAQSVFQEKANGSLLTMENKCVGSKLIGQSFDENLYFWSRPSTVNYQTMPSGASNLSVVSQALKTTYLKRKKHFLELNQLADSTTVPSEMLFASASGLDPHISVKAALLQVQRIAKNRKLDEQETRQLLKIIDGIKESRQLGLFGEPKINVLVLNVQLDKLKER